MHTEFYLYEYFALSIHVCSDLNPDTTFFFAKDRHFRGKIHFFRSNCARRTDLKLFEINLQALRRLCVHRFKQSTGP